MLCFPLLLHGHDKSSWQICFIAFTKAQSCDGNNDVSLLNIESKRKKIAPYACPLPPVEAPSNAFIATHTQTFPPQFVQSSPVLTESMNSATLELQSRLDEKHLLAALLTPGPNDYRESFELEVVGVNEPCDQRRRSSTTRRFLVDF